MYVCQLYYQHLVVWIVAILWSEHVDASEWRYVLDGIYYGNHGKLILLACLPARKHGNVFYMTSWKPKKTLQTLHYTWNNSRIPRADWLVESLCYILEKLSSWDILNGVNSCSRKVTKSSVCSHVFSLCYKLKVSVGSVCAVLPKGKIGERGESGPTGFPVSDEGSFGVVATDFPDGSVYDMLSTSPINARRCVCYDCLQGIQGASGPPGAKGFAGEPVSSHSCWQSVFPRLRRSWHLSQLLEKMFLRSQSSPRNGTRCDFFFYGGCRVFTADPGALVSHKRGRTVAQNFSHAHNHQRPFLFASSSAWQHLNHCWSHPNPQTTACLKSTQREGERERLILFPPCWVQVLQRDESESIWFTLATSCKGRFIVAWQYLYNRLLAPIFYSSYSTATPRIDKATSSNPYYLAAIF